MMASFPNAVAFDDDTDEVNFVCDATDVHDDFYDDDNDEKKKWKEYVWNICYSERTMKLFFIFANCFIHAKILKI